MGNHFTLLDTAITASILAGKEILKIYNNPAAGFSIERKADNSPLTIADKTAHKVITHNLKNNTFLKLKQPQPFNTLI